MVDAYKTLSPLGGTPREIAEVVRGIMQGKINSVAEVTLTASSPTTLFEHDYLGPNSWIGFMPLTATAKAEGTPYVTGQTRGAATLNHAVAASVDRSYRVIILG